MKEKIFLITLILFSKSAFSEYAISATEILQMPPFCRGLSISNFQYDAQKLRKRVRIPGQHTQHFCHGMKSIIRRQYATAIKEFEYVQQHSTKRHSLIPATSLYKAEALGKLGKVNPALEEYYKAIQLKKKYSQAYSRLASYYIKLNRKSNAIETVKLGLKYLPHSKTLKKKLKRLQSKK